jgi:hypothetical protein
MSLLTGQYFDVPIYDQGYGHYEQGAPSKTSKRRFFRSTARWDEKFERVLVGKQGMGGGLPVTAFWDLAIPAREEVEEEEESAVEEMEIDDEEEWDSISVVLDP